LKKEKTKARKNLAGSGQGGKNRGKKKADEFVEARAAREEGK